MFNDISEESCQDGPRGAPPGGPRVPGDSSRVLVLEHDRATRAFLAETLGRSCRVTVAASGAEGIRLALADPPDLILSDAKMPGLPGDGLVQALRGCPELDEVPILCLTDPDDAALRVKMLRMGAGDFLFKPFSTEELLARVEALLEGRRRARAARRSLEEAEREVLRAQASLEDRVAERTAELERANSELECFSYAVSHDLRAPLRAMGCFSQALLEDLGPRLQGEERIYLDHIIQASARMADLIEGILQLSRTGREGQRLEWVDLTPIAERIRLELQRCNPGQPACWDIATGLKVWGDPRQLGVILANLLGNAWKYSSLKDEIRISVQGEALGGATRVIITDAGAGFDMAHAAKLFLPFQRLHRQDEFPGLGIGLATTQRIVRRHGGSIEAFGRPGLGATFTLTFPNPAESAP